MGDPSSESSVGVCVGAGVGVALASIIAVLLVVTMIVLLIRIKWTARVELTGDSGNTLENAIYTGTGQQLQ